MFPSTSRHMRWGAVLLACLGALVAAGCGSGGKEIKVTGDSYPGVDLANTRFVHDGGIDRANAAGLHAVWKVPLKGGGSFGIFASIPVVNNGVLYAQDLNSNVMAIDLETGDVLWTKTFEDESPGPNGITIAEGRVYGATTEKAFALDATDGGEVWSIRLTRTLTEAIDMAPGYHDGRVYVSTAVMGRTYSYPPGAIGILWALDAKTGKKLWHFNTVPNGLWGDLNTNSGGGLWYPPSFDDKGFMYFGVGNPGPFPGTSGAPWGSSRPGPNPYTDSMVKLNEKTGKLQWYYQQTPHDIYDWDFQDPPILVKAGRRELAVGAGKSGVVVALDAHTGRPVWKRSVGIHNGHDHDSLYAMRKEYSKLHAGDLILPGLLGGVLAPMASNSTTLFVPVVDYSARAKATGGPGGMRGVSKPKGELVALDLRAGKVLWVKKYGSPLYGAPIAVNDMVFAVAMDGTVFGLGARDGKEVWKAKLPANANAGLIADGKTLVAPAGVSEAQAAIVAYRVGK